jgi:hypothetical protein
MAALRVWMHLHAQFFAGAALATLVAVVLASIERLERRRLTGALLLIFAALLIAWMIAQGMFQHCSPELPCD